MGRENYKREKLRREAHFPVWHRGEVATREIEVTNFHLFAIFPFMRRNRGEIVYLIAITFIPFLIAISAAVLEQKIIASFYSYHHRNN